MIRHLTKNFIIHLFRNKIKFNDSNKINIKF